MASGRKPFTSASPNNGMEKQVTATTCEHCGRHFNTTVPHPSRYCSIGCEEGRAPLPEQHPDSDGYHLHLQAEPQSLIGRNLVAHGLKRTDYSPDWHRDLDEYNSRQKVSVDEENSILVYVNSVHLGKVVDYESGEGYTVERENLETGEVHCRTIGASLTVSQIRQDNWWVE